jgi:drug/metabolite transporter (DMT)-like permease
MTELSGRRSRATAIGAGAILLWSTLAVLGTRVASLPPFQTTAIAFAVAAVAGFATLAATGRPLATGLSRAPIAWAVGLFGLFGYHACFFAALAWAPPVQANLLNYLWPLLIVLFAAVLPGERLSVWHVAGVTMGLAGAGFVVAGAGAGPAQADAWPGYLAAVAAAVIWAAYSVASRRLGSVATETVAGFCAGSALLAWAAHGALETWTPPTTGHWMALLLLGLGPVGAAFFAWDHGVKRGDIRALAGFSYATPLASTGLLLLDGAGEPTALLGLAALLIVGGALLAAHDLWARQRRPALDTVEARPPVV